MTCEGPLPCRWPCPVGGWGGVGLQQDASRGHSADSGCGPGPPAAAWPLGGHAAAHLSLHPDGAVPTKLANHRPEVQRHGTRDRQPRPALLEQTPSQHRREDTTRHLTGGRELSADKG